MHRPNSLAAQHRRALGSSCTPQCSKVKEYARESGREPTSRQRRTLKKASVDLCALQPSSREKSEPTIFAGTMPSYVGARCQREARCLHLAATPTAKLSHPSQASRTGDRGAARSRRGPLQAEARTLGVSCRVSPGTTTDDCVHTPHTRGRHHEERTHEQPITLGAMGVRSGGISGARTTGGSDSLSSLREAVVGWVGARDTQQLSGAVVVETHRTRLLSRVAVPPAVRIMYIPSL